MKKEPVSRILKTHTEIMKDFDGENTGAEVQHLASFLKEVLLRDEADLKTIAHWIHSRKRLINNEVAALNINDTNRKVLLDEIKHLESLRQQLLTTFLSKQAAYQSLMNAEQELAKRYEQENADQKPAAATPAQVSARDVKKRKSRSPGRR